MRKFCYILLTALLLHTAAVADNTQTVILNDGSVLQGYMQSQDKKHNIVFCCSEATITKPASKVKVTNRHAAKLSELSADECAWAERNSVSSADGTVILADVTISGNTLSNVILLEEGEKVSFHYSKKDTRFSFKWKDIKIVKANRRSSSSGIDITYTLKNGSKYTGQYAQETDSTLSLYLPDGVMRTFPLYDVIKYEYIPHDSTQSILQQSPYLDIIKTEKASYKGVITVKDYDKNLFTIQQQDGTPWTVSIYDILQTIREPNIIDAPAPLDTIATLAPAPLATLLAPDTLATLLAPTLTPDTIATLAPAPLDTLLTPTLTPDTLAPALSPDSLAKKALKNGDIVYYDGVTNNITLKTGIFTIEYSANSNGTERYKLMVLVEDEMRFDRYEFKLSDMSASTVAPADIRTNGDVTRATYNVTVSGYYMLYNAENGLYVPLTFE